MFLAQGDSETVSESDDLIRLQNTLLQSVDKGFFALGVTVREALYQCINRNYQLRREKIPDHLETFHQALHNLGAGAKIMEKLIARNLYTKLGLNFTEHANCTLVDIVNHARREAHRSVSEC